MDEAFKEIVEKLNILDCIEIVPAKKIERASYNDVVNILSSIPGNVVFTAQDIENLLLGSAEMKEIECTDISRLKKKIKHCQNPLERRFLERQLNKAYKKRKQKEILKQET